MHHLTPVQNSTVIKAVFQGATVESSSDFIVLLWKLSKYIPELKENTMLYQWEYDNCFDSWEANVNFISYKMKNTDPRYYSGIYHSYVDILKLFLDNRDISPMYTLGVDDIIGWRIFKELQEKRWLCYKFLRNNHV